MSKVYLFNPTDKRIEVVIGGVSYEAPAHDYARNLGKEKIKGLSFEHATYWKEKLHNFLEVREMVEEKKVESVEELPVALVNEELEEMPDQESEEKKE